MYCGQCCVMEPRSRAALRLDIFIEILLGIRVNRSSINAPNSFGWHHGWCLPIGRA
jgi:hypothetical protein